MSQRGTAHTVVRLVSDVGPAVSQSKVIVDLILLELLLEQGGCYCAFPCLGFTQEENLFRRDRA